MVCDTNYYDGVLCGSNIIGGVRLFLRPGDDDPQHIYDVRPTHQFAVLLAPVDPDHAERLSNGAQQTLLHGGADD